MNHVEIGKFMCGQKIDFWNVKKWDSGKGCIAKCEKLANIYGFGCCEARYRSYGAFCRFGKTLVKHKTADTKAVNCLGELFEEFNVFSMRFVRNFYF